MTVVVLDEPSSSLDAHADSELSSQTAGEGTETHAAD
jgi:ABC-type sulfate/molybdate transport systems ATPase subunit